MNMAQGFIRRKEDMLCKEFAPFPVDPRLPLRSKIDPKDDYTVLPINNPYKPGLYKKPFFRFQSYAFAGKVKIPTEPTPD